MPQKTLFKQVKKIQKKTAANRHGKTPQTKKGSFVKPPKKASLQKQYQEEAELTRTINKNNESVLASKAETTDGRLQLLKPPPFAATTQQKQKAATQKRKTGASKE